MNEDFSTRSVGSIHKALAQAEAWNLVKKNVARLARPPKETHSEPYAMTVEEARAFLRAIDGDHLEALYLLVVTTGLRRGELLGLKWSNLDLERGYLRVERSLDTLYIPAMEDDPKRASSRRPAGLPPVIAAFKSHRKRRAAEKQAAEALGLLFGISNRHSRNPYSRQTPKSRRSSTRSYKKNSCKYRSWRDALGRTRTCDLLIRSQLE